MEVDVRPTVKLWDSIGFGVIIDYPSGVFYSNQTGGVNCLQPKAEGVYVPLCNDIELESRKLLSPEVELYNYFEGPKYQRSGATSGLDMQDADFIDNVLKNWRLSNNIEVDLEHLKESHEAWVHVVIFGDEGSSYFPDIAGPNSLSMFSGFDPYPRAGILTWRNTD